METLRQWFDATPSKPTHVLIDSQLIEWADVPAELLDAEFDGWYGRDASGRPFVTWYDESEWFQRKKRNPPT